MVSYYNSTNMYRHQQAVTTPANAPMHSWYAGYHQAQVPPGVPGEQGAMWEQQMWHHHQHAHHSVFNEFPDFHSGMPHDAGHNQLMPSPTITVSGSEMSSPGGNGNISPQNPPQRPAPARSPYEWIKKTSYQSQPNPEIDIQSSESLLLDAPDTLGKTRTKDKYRVVYTDLQRIELEKEFTFNNKYITIRRKSELASSLGLSERQIKIWFQNRRAKERKQNKKRLEEKSQMYHQQMAPMHQDHLIVGIPAPSANMMHNLVNYPLKTESSDSETIDNIV